MIGYLQIGIIFLGAVGAALLLGTGFAWLRFRREGAFPNQPAHASAADIAAAKRSAVTKMLLGLIIVLAAVRILFNVGLSA